jgi:restriction endonuclease S subunit
MNDSGVEWLGEIPAGWEVRKVSHVFKIGSGTTPRSDSGNYYGGDIPWVTTSELRETVITETNETLTEVALRDHSALKMYPEGSLLIAMYGATIGRLGLLGIPATVNQACCVFTEPKDVDARFVFYWFQMRRPVLISLGSGGGQPNLSQDILRSVRISLPNLLEQRAIVTYLDEETAKIESLIAKIRVGIDRLKEYRTALISAAVTGKIDVRKEVA